MRVEGWRTNLREPVRDPRRIVSIAPSNTEILHVLGLSRRIVGVDRWSDYPPRVNALPRVGSDLRVEVDRVLELRPDLVVASLHVPGMEDNLPAFETSGLPYLAVGGVGLEGVWEDIRLVGQLTGRRARAEAVIARSRDRMSIVAARLADVPRRPRVHWEWSAHPYVAAGRSWMTELIRMAGGENVYADLDTETARVSVEEAVARQPDVVIACWCGARRPWPASRVAARRGWESTPAVREGRVFVVTEALFGRPGPRLAEGLERLAALLHSESASP